MSKKLKVLALVLVTILCLSVFAGCKPRETQGSSSVLTQSEVQGDNVGGENNDTDASGVADDENESKADGNQVADNSSTTSGGSVRPGQKIDINKTGWPIVNNKITFKIMGQSLPSRGDPTKMSQFKYVEELTNIKTTFIGVVESKMTERKTLALQSGDMPDLFAGFSWTDVEISKYTSGKKPKLIDANEYIADYAPNIAKIIKDDPTEKAINVTADGKMYTIPNRPNETYNFDHWLNINKKWLQELGYIEDYKTATVDEVYEVVNTPEKFLKILEEFRDKIPGILGVSEVWPFAMWNWGGNFITSWWGVQTTMGHIGIDLNGKVYYPYATTNARDACRYWNIIRNADHLMQSSIVGSSDGYWAKFTTHIKEDNVGAFVWSYLSDSAFPSKKLEEYVAIPFPAAGFNNPDLKLSKVANPFNNTPSRGSWVITSSCKNVPAMIRMLDYYTTNDGIMVGNWGTPKNGNYTVNKDGTYTLTNQKMINNSGDWDNAMGWAMGINEPGKANITIKKNTSSADYKNTTYDNYNAQAIKTYSAAHKKNPVYYMANVQKTAKEIAQLRKFDAAGFDVNGPMSSYVTGNWKIQDWDTRVDNWNKKGLKDYLKLYQSIVDRNSEGIIKSNTY